LPWAISCHLKLSYANSINSDGTVISNVVNASQNIHLM
jgi:hypothetical protein